MGTADVSYVPGTLTAVAGDRCWALVEIPPDSPSVTRIWRQLGQGMAADALLVSLLADGIGGAPGFTLLVAGPDGRHRLFCRGAVGATVIAGPPDGGDPYGGDPYGGDPYGAGPAAPGPTAVQVDGAGLLTWREQLVDNAERIFLGAPPADTALRLPATSGVLLAGCVVVDLTMTTTRPGRLAAQSSAAPLPAAPLPAGQQRPDDLGPAGTPIPTMPFAGPIGPPVPPGAPGRPDASGPGALPAPMLPAPVMPAPVVAAATGTAGSRQGDVPGGVAAVTRSAPVAGRTGDDAEHDLPWPGPSPTVADPPFRAAGPGDLPSGGSFSPGGAPFPGGYAGAGPQPPSQYHGAPLPAGQGKPRLAAPGNGRADGSRADAAWADGGRSEWVASPGARPASLPNGPAALPPMPVRAPGPLGGGSPPSTASAGPAGSPIDAVPWLSGPGDPTSVRAVPVGPATARPGPAGPVSAGPVSAGPISVGPVSAGPGPNGPVSAEPPYLPRAESRPGESGSAVKRGELSERIARTVPPDRIGPVVPALLCPNAHVNPPSGPACRRCGAPLPRDPVPVPRPVLGVLRLSVGDVITLDRGVLMGRNPRTDFTGAEGEERPHVVKLPSADGDMSRTHLRVTLDGWHVLVTDLNSTNGTLITLPGRDPQQLRPGEPVPIQPGTVVTLADGIDFRYEVTD